jgi:hypothetical protein
MLLDKKNLIIKKVKLQKFTIIFFYFSKIFFEASLSAILFCSLGI